MAEDNLYLFSEDDEILFLKIVKLYKNKEEAILAMSAFLDEFVIQDFEDPDYKNDLHELSERMTIVADLSDEEIYVLGLDDDGIDPETARRFDIMLRHFSYNNPSHDIEFAYYRKKVIQRLGAHHLK